MDSLVLSDAQKARLQRVANGMLQIYNTLARMRYLDTGWIVAGPHDIADEIDDYRSFGLEDSVIYLYSILPYLHPDFVGEVDFYSGGEFIDFRNTSCLGQSREPLYTDDEKQETLKPWMTPLSMGGNDGVALVYSTKTNRIWMRTSSFPGSIDPAIMSADYDWRDDEDEDSCSGSDGESSSHDCSNENGNEDDDENDDGDDDGNEDDEDEDGEDDDKEEDEDGYDDDDDDESPYSEDSSRPATAVLRDINQWFLELKALPGGGEYSSTLWDKTVTRQLYEKHGWPTNEFDGDAFLVDLVRHDARVSSTVALTRYSKKLRRLQHSAEEYADPAHWAYYQGLIDEETDIERKWLARYELWAERRGQSITARRLAFVRAKQHANPELTEAERLDGEVGNLMELLCVQKGRLTKANASIPMQEGPEMRAARLRQKQAQCNIRVYTRAHEEAQAALKELKGGAATGGNGDQANARTSDKAAAEAAAKDKEDERHMERENAEESIADAKAFLETIPPGIKQARAAADDFIKRWEHML